MSSTYKKEEDGSTLVQQMLLGLSLYKIVSASEVFYNVCSSGVILKLRNY